MGWNLPDDVTGNEDYFQEEPEVYEEYTAKIEISITQMGRDESEGLEKIEDLLQRAQFIEDYDILDIKKEGSNGW